MWTEKKLVTRLPNFPDRRVRHGSFLLKNVVTNKIEFLEFLNFFNVGLGKWVVFFIIFRYFKQLFPIKPCAILYLLKDRVANPTP